MKLYYLMTVVAPLVTPMSVGTFLAGIPAGYLALLGTIIGTIGLKLVEKWLGKNNEKATERRDLNTEVNELVKRVDSLEKEVTFWRSRFYEEQEDNSTLRVQMITGGMQPPAKRVVPPNEFDGNK